MKRWFWIDGRFSWPFVIIVAYVSLLLVVMDYAWRNVTMPFGTLIIYAVAANAAIILLFLGAYRALRTRSHAD